MTRLVWASRAPKGSSSRRMSGAGARARAMATRWRMPPESWWGRVSAKAVRPVTPSSSSIRAARSPRGVRAHSSPKAMFSRTDFHG